MAFTSMQKKTHLSRCTLTGADDTTAHDWVDVEWLLPVVEDFRQKYNTEAAAP